jgi:hypothetical protein
MREDLSQDEVVAVIDRMVEELLAKAGLHGPPVDALALARRRRRDCTDRRWTPWRWPGATSA